MTRLIKLKSGEDVLVDKKDFTELSKYKWYRHKNGYAMRIEGPKRKTKTILMHRFINNTPIGLQTDHINKNKLDNRRCNLRTTTQSENMRNTGARSNTGIKGVYKTTEGRFLVIACVGTFDTISEAEAAYKKIVQARQTQIVEELGSL